MAVDARKYTPPVDKPYRVIDYVNDKFLALWDMSEDTTPHIMFGFEYWDEASRRGAEADMERIARTMNIANGSDPDFVIQDRQLSPATAEQRIMTAIELLDSVRKVDLNQDDDFGLVRGFVDDLKAIHEHMPK